MEDSKLQDSIMAGRSLRRAQGLFQVQGTLVVLLAIASVRRPAMVEGIKVGVKGGLSVGSPWRGPSVNRTIGATDMEDANRMGLGGVLFGNTFYSSSSSSGGGARRVVGPFQNRSDDPGDDGDDVVVVSNRTQPNPGTEPPAWRSSSPAAAPRPVTGGSGTDDEDKIRVSVAVVLPYSMFKQREYRKKIKEAAEGLTWLNLEKAGGFEVSPFLEMLQPLPSPTEVLGKICNHFLPNRTAAVLYLTDNENYGRDSVASQYFMQLAQYVRLPVISWNADNSAFEMAATPDSLQLQLAPTIKHQAQAILTLLERYGWHTFSIVTGTIAGHHNFIQVLRDLISDSREGMEKKTIVDTVVVKHAPVDIGMVARTEARVFLLYSTRKEAVRIFSEANALGLTGKSYVWIATQPVIGSSLDAPEEFPVGMLGVHFSTDSSSMVSNIGPAMSVLGHALSRMATIGKEEDHPHRGRNEGGDRREPPNLRKLVQSDISCDGNGEVRWWNGETLFKYLKGVTIPNNDGQPPIQFLADGSRKYHEVRIVNLQPKYSVSAVLDHHQHQSKSWEEIGTWQVWDNGDDGRSGGKNSYALVIPGEDGRDGGSSFRTTPPASRAGGGFEGGRIKEVRRNKGQQASRVDGTTVGRIDIKDIVWPGGALKPPEGIPEKRFIRVSWLEEDPYVMLSPPTACTASKGVICQTMDDHRIATLGLNVTEERRLANSTVFRCCTGFCVDLLNKFANDLSFDFQMVRVRDGNWGGVVQGKWNGLVAELTNHEADIVMTSLKINSGREKVIDFSVPFLETGITILVAKRTGIISPTAFLEPFDTSSWMLVTLVAIQVAAGCIFFFEWLSPSGYDMKLKHPQGKFSFLRTLWLVWAVLFQAAVNVDCPRGYTSRFMAHVWATFALIFLAIYTANLAAFMITREEFPNLSGLDDSRLENPTSVKPPFRFGTIPNGATDYVLKNNFPRTHTYMKKFNRTTVKEGFKAVKADMLDAFVYDATVLEYLVGQDDECNVLTVGSWYAMTGYGVGFPKGSPWIPRFNEHLMRYRENGDLERMQRFWFTGACEPRKRRRTSSKPLALEQFMSAFLLLGIGISIAGLLLVLEQAYFRYFRQYLASFGRAQWCNLISTSVADSLNQAVDDSLVGTTKDHGLAQGGTPACQLLPLGPLGAPGHKCSDQACSSNLHSVFQELLLCNARIAALQRALKTGDLSDLNDDLPVQVSDDSWQMGDHCLVATEDDVEMEDLGTAEATMSPDTWREHRPDFPTPRLRRRQGARQSTSMQVLEEPFPSIDGTDDSGDFRQRRSSWSSDDDCCSWDNSEDAPLQLHGVPPLSPLLCIRDAQRVLLGKDHSSICLSGGSSSGAAPGLRTDACQGQALKMSAV